MTTRIARDTRLILIGAGVMLSLGMGLRQSLGLFLTPVTRDLALTRRRFHAVAGDPEYRLGAVAGADRRHRRPFRLARHDDGRARRSMSSGSAIMAAAGGVTALLVSGALIGVALSCTASSLAMTAVARAVPEERRSTTLGIVSAGGSLGTLMVPLVTQGLLANWAWQIGALFFVALAAAMLPAAFLAGGIDKVPHHGGASRVSMREMLGQALRHRQFLVLSGAYFVCGLNLVFLATHLPTYLAICGQDPMLAAEAIAVIGGVNCLGSLAAGWLGARYPKHILLGLLYILRAFVFTAYFIMPPTPATTLVFAAAMGMLWLSVAPLVSGLVAEMFGTRYMATLLGLSFVMHQVGSSLGAFGGGLIFDLTGSYDGAWKIGVLIGFTAGVVQIVAGGPAHRRDPTPEPRLATT